uniref:N-myc and STAT interactor n=1 Tax=Amazona collaria TaxID=241587 RepID=A0A8B9EVH1_9PSIT
MIHPTVEAFIYFLFLLKAHLNFFVCFHYCLMGEETSVCLFFFLQSMAPTDPFDSSEDEMERLEEELKKWKKRLEAAEKAKADLLLCKSNAMEEYVKAEDGLIKLKNLQEKQHKEAVMSRDTHEINKEVAEMKLKFAHMEDTKDNYQDMNTQCVFGVTTKIPFRLDQNQVLLTFEDKEVAQRLIKIGKHTVNLDNKTADLRVMPFTLEMGIKFKLHVTISGKKISVSEVPELLIPGDWMRDKLELNFYKSEWGGGEVENVNYDKQSRTAVITFLRPGATNSFVRCTEYPFVVNGTWYRLPVSPDTNVKLENFQLYCGISKKTILLEGIKEMEDDEESVQDMIKIHFQKPNNNGGEIEKIKYASKGVTWVCFEEDT